MRGHTLGRVIWSGSAVPNTGVPGNIGGYTIERVMHSPCAGEFRALRQIGDTVEAGETVAAVGGEPLCAKITGTLRGILPEGFYVPRKGFKSADVDPRCRLFHCFTAFRLRLLLILPLFQFFANSVFLQSSVGQFSALL